MITNEQIDKAIPPRGSGEPHREQPNRILTNNLFKDMNRLIKETTDKNDISEIKINNLYSVGYFESNKKEIFSWKESIEKSLSFDVVEQSQDLDIYEIKENELEIKKENTFFLSLSFLLETDKETNFNLVLKNKDDDTFILVKDIIVPIGSLNENFIVSVNLPAGTYELFAKVGFNIDDDYNKEFEFSSFSGGIYFLKVAEINYVNTLDSQNVKLTGNQTIAGTKTFSLSPIVPFLTLIKNKEQTTSPFYNGYKGVTLLGDSISHGAFAGNIYMNGYARILQRLINNELNSRSYGSINFLTLGWGTPFVSRDVHSVDFVGSWSGTDIENSRTGGLMTSQNVGDRIIVTIPFFQNRVCIPYAKKVGGGSFDVYINGVVVSSINTANPVNDFLSGFTEVAMVDNGKGSCTISITITSAGAVSIGDFIYMQSEQGAMFNAFATSGRKLANVSNGVIEEVCSNSSCVILALGHNDTYNANLVSRIDKFIEQCNLNKIKLVVPDFRWSSPKDDNVRKELKRLCDNVPSSLYIPFADYFTNDGTIVDDNYKINVLKLFSDGSHPNKDGHKLIAETIAKKMGLSSTTKKDALGWCDYWFPMTLNPSISVENTIKNNPGSISSFKRQGDTVLFKFYGRMSSSGAFPTGTHTLQTATTYPYGFTLLQPSSSIGYIRPDTGEVVSDVEITSQGQININVRSSFTTNQVWQYVVQVRGDTY